jgi:hypothetical protein
LPGVPNLFSILAKCPGQVYSKNCGRALFRFKVYGAKRSPIFIRKTGEMGLMMQEEGLIMWEIIFYDAGIRVKVEGRRIF